MPDLQKYIEENHSWMVSDVAFWARAGITTVAQFVEFIEGDGIDKMFEINPKDYA